jgi:hypothetical protein
MNSLIAVRDEPLPSTPTSTTFTIRPNPGPATHVLVNGLHGSRGAAALNDLLGAGQIACGDIRQ